MSDRLAIAAAFSVLMMSVFALIGTHVTIEELLPASLRGSSSIGDTVSVALPLR